VRSADAEPEGLTLQARPQEKSRKQFRVASTDAGGTIRAKSKLAAGENSKNVAE
jgi:hypothetical protein